MTSTSSRRTRQAARRRSRATGEPLSVARRRAADPDPAAITAAWQQLRDAENAGAEWDAIQQLLRILPGRLDLVDALDWTATDTGVVARINPRLAEAGIVLPGEIRAHIVTAAARELGVDVDIAVAPGSLGISVTTAYGAVKVTVVTTIDTDTTGLDAVTAEALVTAHRAIRP